jgi:hypothetical protein
MRGNCTPSASHHISHPSRNHTSTCQAAQARSACALWQFHKHDTTPISSTSRSCAAKRNVDRAQTLLRHCMPAVHLTCPGPPFHPPPCPVQTPFMYTREHPQAQQPTAGACNTQLLPWGLCKDQQAFHCSSRNSTSQTLQARLSHQDELAFNAGSDPGSRSRACQNQLGHWPLCQTLSGPVIIPSGPATWANLITTSW